MMSPENRFFCSINQSLALSFYQSIYLSINQSINQSIYQSINQSINLSINQSINQSINHQSTPLSNTEHTTSPPTLSLTPLAGYLLSTMQKAKRAEETADRMLVKAFHRLVSTTIFPSWRHRARTRGHAARAFALKRASLLAKCARGWRRWAREKCDLRMRGSVLGMVTRGKVERDGLRAWRRWAAAVSLAEGRRGAWVGKCATHAVSDFSIDLFLH